MQKPLNKVVIPAAGLGTRLLPATKAQPKEMLPLVDRPAIQYVVEEATAAGFNDLLIITGRGKRALEDHFDRSIELEVHLEAKGDLEKLAAVREISNGPSTYFIRQKEAKGLGHAVLCAEKHVGGEAFAVMLGDDIFVGESPAVAQLAAFYHRRPGIILALQEVPAAQVSLYGIVKPSGELGKDALLIDDLIEKPAKSEAPSNLAIVGRYILPPEIFKALRATKPGKKGEIQLTDAIRLLRGRVPIYGLKFKGRRFDIGGKLSYLTTNIELALTRKDLSGPLREFIRKLAAEG